MKIMSRILISGLILLTGCSSSVSQEDCDNAFDELLYLYQTEQDNDEYFYSVQEFIVENC